MSFSRQVGSVGQMVDLFVQNATVTTGVGLPNVEISNFAAYYHRTHMTSTSTVTLVSTGTMGTWSSGQWKQINSTLMMGWYQFCCPNGMFVTGSSVSLHMYGHASMAPVVARFDIERFNNQGWVSSEPHNVTRLYSDAAVTSAAGVLAVDVSSIQRGSAVTTAAGRLAVGAVGVSAFALPVGVSSFGVAVDVTSFYGSALVTSAAGVVGVGSVDISSAYGSGLVTSAAGRFAVGAVGVSAFALPVGISSNTIGVNVTSIVGTAAITTVAGYFPTHFDLALTRNITSTVDFENVSISTLMSSVSFGGSVDVTSFWGSGVVTTAAGRLAVGAVGVSSVTDKAGYSVSSISVGVSTSWFSGGTIATSQAGVLRADVSSVMGTKAVTTVAGYFPTHFDLSLTRNVDSTVTFSSVNLSTAPVLDVSTIIGQMSTANISTVRFHVSTVLTPISVGSVDVTSVWGSNVVTTAAGRLAVGAVGVSSVTDKAGYSVSSISVGVSTSWFSGGTVVTSAVGVLAVDVSSIQRGSAVTSAAGRLAVGAVGVSAFALPVGVSSFAIGVDVTSILGTAAVTTVAGYFPTHFDLGLTRNVDSTVAFSSVSWSSQSVTVGSVDVTSFWGSGLVTTAAGRLAVGAVGVSSITPSVRVTSIAVNSGFLDVNISSVAGQFITGTGVSSDPWGPV